MGRSPYNLVPLSLRHVPKDEIVRAMRLCKGIVFDTATMLAVPTEDPRKMARTDPDLVNVVLEAIEARADKSERIIDQALDSPDPRWKFAAASFYLRNSTAARSRGYAPPAARVEVNMNGGGFLVQKFGWANGEIFAAHIRNLSEMRPEEQERARSGGSYYEGPIEAYDELLEDGTRRALTAETRAIGVNSRIVPRLEPPAPRAMEEEVEPQTYKD